MEDKIRCLYPRSVESLVSTDACISVRCLCEPFGYLLSFWMVDTKKSFVKLLASHCRVLHSLWQQSEGNACHDAFVKP